MLAISCPLTLRSGPGSLLLYGAATFLYELFPGEGGSPDEAVSETASRILWHPLTTAQTMMSFFAISKDANGNYVQNSGERVPPNWRPRVESYDSEVTSEILQMYLLNVSCFAYLKLSSVTD